MRGSKAVTTGAVLALAMGWVLVGCGSDDISSGDVVAGVESGSEVAATMRALDTVHVAASTAGDAVVAEATYDQAHDATTVLWHLPSGDRTLLTVGDAGWLSWPGSPTPACRAWGPAVRGLQIEGLLDSSDANAWWMVLDEATSNVAEGTDEIDGVAATRYHGTFDLAAVLAKAKVTEPGAVAPLEGLVASVRRRRPLEGPPTSVPIDFWLDAKGRLVRLEVSVVPTGTAKGEEPKPVQLLDAKFSAFDAPVSIVAPAAGDVVDQSLAGCA